MQTVLPELRYALKQLCKNPGYSLVVIVTLALSIGANTAIFSVVDALLLRPLPYPEPERLGSLMQRISGPANVTYPINIDGETWRYLRDIPAVTAAVSSKTGGVNLEAAGRAQYVHGQRISASYLDVLGLRPLIGRSFTAALEFLHLSRVSRMAESRQDHRHTVRYEVHSFPAPELRQLLVAQSPAGTT